jgi:hypoxanthine-DNA glycosylase
MLTFQDNTTTATSSSPARIVANDFVSFYRKHPHIRQVFFNGTKAEQEYRKRVLPGLPDTAQDIAYARLPSTSPAMAQLSFEQKLAAWSQALRGNSTGQA